VKAEKPGFLHFGFSPSYLGLLYIYIAKDCGFNNIVGNAHPTKSSIFLTFLQTIQKVAKMATRL